jgi:hypothetical protein
MTTQQTPFHCNSSQALALLLRFARSVLSTLMSARRPQETCEL